MNILDQDNGKDSSKPAAGKTRGGRFFLLLFILLVSALAYMYMQHSIKVGHRERAEELTAQVMQFPAVVRTGVARMHARGIALDDLNFNPDAQGMRAVFHKKGGAVRYQLPPPGILTDGGKWMFKTVNAKGEGWFIAGAGRDDHTGKDVIAALSGLPLGLCERINHALGLAPRPKVESVTVDLSRPAGAEDYAGLNAWTFAVHAQPVGPDGANTSPSAACIRNGEAGAYVYYHLLAAQ
ncbi:MAG: hypothetical protein RBS08_06590 [Bdellovibrionales bacterium]|jgi:hypothetical protein|nr:hypothetical protein [Bdellovibrionales bacterium]